jgi:hypothetical protein
VVVVDSTAMDAAVNSLVEPMELEEKGEEGFFKVEQVVVRSDIMLSEGLGEVEVLTEMKEALEEEEDILEEHPVIMNFIHVEEEADHLIVGRIN